jgi:UDP-N-acetylmuramyl pentapeptide phosphotransferase/UDP-N-acetylglucosamine-1-phosphate transferase
MFENPSAGKFEPPPSSQPTVERPSNPRVIGLVIFVVIWVVTYWLKHSFPGQGWVRLISGLIALGLGTLDVFMKRKRDDEIEGKDPYSPPTSITR